MKSLPALAFAALALFAGPSLACDRAFLGVGVAPSEDGKGLRIQEITDASAAEKAGLKSGDVILRFDGKEVAEFEALASAVQAHKAGEKVEVVYLRDGEEKTLEVELGAAPAEMSVEVGKMGEDADEGDEGDEEGEVSAFRVVPGRLAFETVPQENAGAWLGVRLERDDEGNVTIAEVLPESPAKRVGLKKGDRILLFKGKPGGEIEETIQASKPGDKVEVKILRGEDDKELVVVLGKKGASASVLRVPGGLALRGMPQAPRAQVVVPRVETLRLAPIETLRLAPVAPRAEAQGEATKELLEEIRALRKEVRELREKVEKLSAR